MEKDILFSEKQRFNQWWFWLIILTILGISTYAFDSQIINGKPFGNNPMSNNALIIICISSIIFCMLLANFKLETQIKTDGIYVKFFPFHFRYQFYSWDSLEKVFTRTYSPISEYGGWGLRYSFSGKGKAYNISGNQGLQLEFKNGKKLLIGTEKTEEMQEVLLKILKSNKQLNS